MTVTKEMHNMVEHLVDDFVLLLEISSECDHCKTKFRELKTGP